MECSICGDLFPQAELSPRDCCLSRVCSQCREESPHCIDCDKFITTREVNQEQLQSEITRIQEIGQEQTRFYCKHLKSAKGANAVELQKAYNSDAKAIRLHLELLQDLSQRLSTLSKTKSKTKTVLIPVTTFIRSKDCYFQKHQLVNSNGYLRPYNSSKQQEFCESHHINYSWSKSIPVGCAYLSYLDLSQSTVFNLKSLAGATRLTKLRLAQTNVSDLYPISHLALVALDISYTMVTNLSDLKHMKTLRNLTATAAKIEDISGIAGLSLKTLMLDQNYCSDLTALANMPLTKLNLACVLVNDITVLATLKDLTWLSLAYSQVSDLTPLAGLGLVQLDLNNSAVTDLTALTAMNTLRKLNIASTRVTDFEPVRAIAGLELIWLI